MTEWYSRKCGPSFLCENNTRAHFRCQSSTRVCFWYVSNTHAHFRCESSTRACFRYESNTWAHLGYESITHELFGGESNIYARPCRTIESNYVRASRSEPWAGEPLCGSHVNWQSVWPHCLSHSFWCCFSKGVLYYNFDAQVLFLGTHRLKFQGTGEQ